MNKIYYKDIPYKVGGESTLVEATITERGETSASDFRADGFSKVNVDVPYTDVHYAKDDIVSFEGEDFPLKSLTADITAIQDLHGYDYPWVGGSGRNLFSVGSRVDGTIADVRYTSDDEYIYLNGTKQGIGYADLSSASNITLDSGTYYIRAFVISGTASNTVELYAYDGTNNLTGNIINNERTLTLSESKTFRFRFAIWTDGTALNNYKVGIVISKTPNIDKFYPYSNICPINGWNGVNVTVADATTSPTVSNVYSLTFTDGTNPLTVYGGYVDLVSGVLTVDRAYVDLGTLDWQYSSISERFYVGASDLGVKATDASTPFNAISSALIAKSYNEIEAKTVDYAIGINPNATQLFARYSSITSASDFITAMNGVQLVYELATPLTYQLSKQQIKSLVGVNNIFADTGEVAVEWQTLYQTP